MAEPAPKEELFDVECPHCRRAFRGKLLSRASRHAGFKCPHCKLFVAFERTAEPDRPA